MPLLVTVKLNAGFPKAVATVTDAAPTQASEATLNVALTEAPFEVTLLNVRPGHVVDNEALHRFGPLIVTVPVQPRAALDCDGVVTEAVVVTVTGAETARYVSSPFSEFFTAT